MGRHLTNNGGNALAYSHAKGAKYQKLGLKNLLQGTFKNDHRPVFAVKIRFR
jgi:hypothetical protein